MKKISILVLEGCTPIAPIGAMEIMNKASVIYQQLSQSGKPFFITELVGTKRKRVKVSDSFSIDCHTTIDKITQTDLILIPAIEFDVEEKINRNKNVIPHILRLHRKGTEVGSMCTGAFLLAATGLLKNKTATTHWYTAPAFRTRFPDIKVMDEKIVIDDNGIYTCGGATSFLNLCLYLVEKFCGRETAVMTSKMLLLDFDKTHQSNYSMFIPQMTHADDAILKAQKHIENNNHAKISVDELAKHSNLSKRNFIRRFKASTGNTPIEYIQRIIVEKSKRQLEHSDDTVGNIAFSLGYNDIHSFRKLFSRVTGMTPKTYRSKYKRR